MRLATSQDGFAGNAGDFGDSRRVPIVAGSFAGLSTRSQRRNVNKTMDDMGRDWNPCSFSVDHGDGFGRIR